MKNFKKIAFGLLVGALAIGFSSFTTGAKRSAGDVFVNEANDGSYTKLSVSYDPSNCSSASRPCAYSVTAAGASHISGGTLTSAQITTAINNGWITQEGSDQGVYQQ